MADMAKELIAAKIKLEDRITELVNAFQKEAGVQVNWANFNRRDGAAWPVPVFYTSIELSLNEPTREGLHSVG